MFALSHKLIKRRTKTKRLCHYLEVRMKGSVSDCHIYGNETWSLGKRKETLLRRTERAMMKTCVK